jgi:hypothetical protein
MNPRISTEEIYVIYRVEAFCQGHMPSNAQIDETLNYINAHSPINLDTLFMQDSRDILIDPMPHTT